ncbi:hypothetical protein ETU10_08815 [Apibacter muscae]|uniref:hypothetical protein n=1 Tax=Apibacter muscae TaxID=2509004 RepID=UPI0011AC4DE2|nr:hypothetical protein [Apibacter muscae]TWP22688.1 hypothetical protein ETU10_08815 [Apibacter muscae]
MKQINIPFQLGMQYENWEFDLEPIQDRFKGYDSYLYRGKEFNYFMNYSTDKTELIFNLDRLEMVILTFFNWNINKLEELKVALNSKYGFPLYMLPLKYKVNKNLKYYLIYKKKNSLILIYGNFVCLEKIYSNLLE